MGRPIDILNEVREIREPTTVTISPGPFVVRCGWQDAVAVRVLDMLEELTTQQVRDVLLAALWWVDMFSSYPRAGPVEGEEG